MVRLKSFCWSGYPKSRYDPVKSRRCLHRQSKIWFLLPPINFAQEDLAFFSVEDLCIVCISRVSLKKEPRPFSLSLVFFCGAFLVLTIRMIERYTNYNRCSCIQLSLRLRKCCQDFQSWAQKWNIAIPSLSNHFSIGETNINAAYQWQPGIQNQKGQGKKNNGEKYHIQLLAWTNSDLNGCSWMPWIFKKVEHIFIFCMCKWHTYSTSPSFPMARITITSPNFGATYFLDLLLPFGEKMTFNCLVLQACPRLASQIPSNPNLFGGLVTDGGK